MIFRGFDESEMHYFTKKCSSLTADELAEVSKLFSEHYGVYSSHNPDQDRRGSRIKLGTGYYRKLALQQNTYVALAEYHDKLVGQAFYILESTTGGNMTWVIQLVVHKAYRRHEIGKKLLFSVWGFSNDRAWGLATTNPLTIKTLESATLRKVNLTTMKNNIQLIRQIAQKVSFVKMETVAVSDTNATVFSNFYVSHEDIPHLIKYYGKEWAFGDLAEGSEWLAFVFSGQDVKEISRRELNLIFEHSEKCLADAYSRMKMPQQPWTKHTSVEADFIEKYLLSKESVIADIGCGKGRHTAELFRRGYKNITGYDFSERNISDAKTLYPEAAAHFFAGDCRYLHPKKKADVVLCLYDVIGSFSEEKQNTKILHTLYRLLRKDGTAVVSVMNMELTENIARNRFDVYAQPKRLFKMKASDIMQNTGNVFDPDYFILDTNTKTIFRKEMFRGDGLLDSEYIVRDRRYTMKEICSLLEHEGFVIVSADYVQAGHWDISLKSTDLRAKEVLVIARKA